MHRERERLEIYRACKAKDKRKRDKRAHTRIFLYIISRGNNNGSAPSFFFDERREREKRDAASDIIPVSHVHSIDQSTTSAPWLLRFGVVHMQTVPYVTISPSNPLFPSPLFFSFLFPATIVCSININE